MRSSVNSSALDKYQSGVTTLEEMTRIIPMDAVAASGCQRCGHDLPAEYRFCPYCGTRRAHEPSDSHARSPLGIAEGILT
jgi:uncharacterized OB-fold protein